jgi:GNAT superfamily N-acetyltransferase
VELELRVLHMVSDRVGGRCGLVPSGPELDPARPVTVVVAAHGIDGAVDPVGAAVGSVAADGTARLVTVDVAPGERGCGIGGQVLRAWCSAVAERGADVVLAEPPAVAAGFLDRHGFGPVGPRRVRVLSASGPR